MSHFPILYPNRILFLAIKDYKDFTAFQLNVICGRLLGPSKKKCFFI